MSKRIYFAGLLSTKNLGDIVIANSTIGLYKAALSDKGNFSIKLLNLQFSSLYLITKILRKSTRILLRLLNMNSINYEISLLKKHYEKLLSNASLIVLVGGGLIKYKYQDFFIFLTALIDVAEKKGVPLIINAAGVEGYAENDSRCQLLKKSLNSKIVKSISTRDDIDTLFNKYIIDRSAKHIEKVADPAVFSNEVYEIEKKKSNIYGFGLVRGKIFLDNERDFTPSDVVDLYANLILEMEKRGLEYQLFTNGLPSDSELVNDIKEKLDRDELDVLEPKTDAELVEIISGFTAVVAARLHANIISYALNIPSVGLVWNDKLALFGNDIGYPERFFEYQNFSADKIVDALILANKQGYEQKKWLEYKQTAKSNIEKVISDWLAGNYK